MSELSLSGDRIRILSISGSLRRGSSNTELLRAAALLAPPRCTVTLYAGLAELPAFNPDRELEEIPTVLDLREQIRIAGGVLICSPEYAHGVPGSLKNALDWIVGSGELVDKPLALWNASPRATAAQASLIDTLTTMSAKLIPEASIAIQLLGKQLDARAIADHPDHAKHLRTALEAFEREIVAASASTAALRRGRGTKTG